MSKGKHNFSVKLNPKLAEKKSTAENNEILIKKFTRIKRKILSDYSGNEKKKKKTLG